MAAKGTYSFLDVMAAITGPGGTFQLGAGAGAAEEGISIDPVEDIDNMAIGADGSGVHSLVASKAATITVRLLKTSPVNALLNAMMMLQRQSAANHGQNIISIANRVSGDVYSARGVAFAKVPPNAYAKIANTIEWVFNATDCDPALGAGVQ